MAILTLDGLVDDKMKLGLYEVGTKVQYKHYGITPNGNKDWITAIGMVAARGPELCGWWHDYLLYFEDKSVGWEMNTSNSIIHDVKENTFNAFRGFPGTFVWATQAQVERIEEDMLMLDEINDTAKMLSRQIEDLKKAEDNKRKLGTLRFSPGDLVKVSHKLGDVAGYVVSCHVGGGNEGEDKFYTVFLPNDFRGESVFDLPTSDYSKFIILHPKYGTFIYAQEDELHKMCK